MGLIKSYVSVSSRLALAFAIQVLKHDNAEFLFIKSIQEKFISQNPSNMHVCVNCWLCVAYD